MNIGSIGKPAMLQTTLVARPANSAKPAGHEGHETAAHEASESRAEQAAEGEVGHKIDAYA